MARRPKVFLDASVLFSAVYSAAGSSRKLILKGLRGEVLLFVSPQVLLETERNLADKAPEALADYRAFLKSIRFRLTRTPSPARVAAWAGRIHHKDAPIMAAAIGSGAEYLVTWNTRHFLRDPDLEKEANILILTPDDLISRIEGKQVGG